MEFISGKLTVQQARGGRQSEKAFRNVAVEPHIKKWMTAVRLLSGTGRIWLKCS